MYKFPGFLKFLLLLLMTGCAASGSATKENGQTRQNTTTQNAFTISQQQSPPQNIQSLQLYKQGFIGSAPIIELNSSEKLLLEFDHIGEGSRQFRLVVSHRDKDWTRSSLPPNFYLDGFSETYFSGGLSSFSQRPSYRHYSYEFPNSQLSFKASGNYLLSVYDYTSNELLFALPFFITENKGSLNTRVESIFAKRDDMRAEDQLFSRYRYPDFVEFPQFDLSFIYSQNQFWGRSRMVDNFDTSTPESVNFHLSRQQAFLSNYEFNTLDIRGLKADGQQILEVNRNTIPPLVVLRRDIQAFTLSPRFFTDSRFGLPTDERNAGYANVQFRLEAANDWSPQTEVYLVGDFNNWTLNKLNSMQFKQESQLWEGKAFIKEGIYAYKYVILRNGAVDDLALDQGYRFSTQSYTTFVYYKDPARNYDRLLKVNQIRPR